MDNSASLFMVFALVLAYFIGSVPTAYIITRITKGVDIRTLGSGNVGATNVFRAIGKRAGILVLFFDALKGFSAVFLLMTFCPQNASMTTYRFLLGLSAILGHVFTPWLGFKGGKGVATGAGVACGIFPINFAIGLSIFIVVLMITRYMSVASMAAGYAFAISALCLWDSVPQQVIAVIAAIFITWTHRANLRRLKEGTEAPFIVRNKKK